MVAVTIRRGCRHQRKQTLTDLVDSQWKPSPRLSQVPKACMEKDTFPGFHFSLLVCLFFFFEGPSPTNANKTLAFYSSILWHFHEDTLRIAFA